MFIVFALPCSVTAQPRRLIGGHAVGIVSGLICYFAFPSGLFGEFAASWQFIIWLVYAVSVGLSMFIMVITDTEHPPAAGTALSIAINGFVTSGNRFCFSVCPKLGDY